MGKKLKWFCTLCPITFESSTEAEIQEFETLHMRVEHPVVISKYPWYLESVPTQEGSQR